MLKADLICAQIQEKVLGGRKPNSFEPFVLPGEKILDGGVVYKNDLAYESKYPNSFFDIWYAPEEGKKRGTLVFFHGGGFLFGDKVGGDPLAESENSSAAILKGLCQRGSNIVSANYCLAPEYRAPHPLPQISDFLSFIVSRGSEYSLDTSKLILMGSSAGGDIVEILGTDITNADYAEQMGINPAAWKDAISGIVVDESALYLNTVSENMELLASAWLGIEPVKGSREAALMDATEYILPGYPPTMTVTSNQEAVFWENTDKLKAVLDRIGTPCAVFDGRKYDEKLSHGFMTCWQSSKGARDCFEQVSAFIDRTLEE